MCLFARARKPAPRARRSAVASVRVQRHMPVPVDVRQRQPRAWLARGRCGSTVGSAFSPTAAEGDGRVNWSGLATLLTEVDEALATVLERLRADATLQQASDPRPAPSLESLEDCRSPDALLRRRRQLQQDSR